MELLGTPAFRYIRTKLSPGQSIITEPGAMASSDAGVDLKTRVNGNILQALIAKFLGGESFFINYFSNPTSQEQRLYLTQKTPGEILARTLNNETLFLQPGAFIAQTEGLKRKVVWAGFSSFIAREGLFKLAFEGQGTVWYGCYGAVIEKELKGEYIVDSGHLLSYPPTVKLRIKLSGGLFSSFFSGEGFVLKLSGSGKIQMQTRSVSGLAGWLNPRFW